MSIQETFLLIIAAGVLILVGIWIIVLFSLFRLYKKILRIVDNLDYVVGLSAALKDRVKAGLIDFLLKLFKGRR